MNKKVALSVLSATVFASMAASAFAAPTSGVYVGGDVDRFYSFNTIFDDEFTTGQLNKEISSTDFENIVFVDPDGKGATIQEILDGPGGYSEVKRDLVKADFEGEYGLVKPDGTATEKYDPRPFAQDGEEPTGDLKVDSVSAINDTASVEVGAGVAVPANSEFAVDFGAELDASTVNTTNVKLLVGNVPVATSVNVDATDASKIVVAPSVALDETKEYTLKVTKDVKDKAGTTLANEYTVTFKVSNKPVVSKVSFVNDAAARSTVELTSKKNVIDPVAYPTFGDTADGQDYLVVKYNKDLDASSVTTATVKLYNVTDGKYVVSAGVGYDADNKDVFFGLNAQLEQNKTYKVEVSGVKALDGNVADNYSFEFKYANDGVTYTEVGPLAGPTTNVYPALEGKLFTQTGVGYQQGFKVQYSANVEIDSASVNATTVKLVESLTGTVVESNVSFAGGMITLVPKAALKESTDYKVVIDGVKNNLGVKLGKKDPQTSFKTGDFTTPTITSSSPVAGGSITTQNNKVELNFSEEINASAVTLSSDATVKTNDGAVTIRLVDNSTDKAIDLTAAGATKVWTNGNKTLTLDFGTALTKGHTYTLLVSGTPNKAAVLKAAKGVATEMTQDFSLVFAAGADTVAPTVKEIKGDYKGGTTGKYVITDGTTNVDDARDLVVAFNDEDVRVLDANGEFDYGKTTSALTSANAAYATTAYYALNATSAVKVYNLTDNAYVTGSFFKVTEVAKTATEPKHHEIAIDETAFAAGKKYRVEFTNRIADDAKNRFVSKNVEFITGVGLVARVVTPGSTTAVVKGSDIEISLSGTTVDTSTVNPQTVKLVNTATGEEVKGTVVYNAGTQRIVLNPTDDLLGSTTYKVVISKDIKDSVGNRIVPAANAQPQDINFTFTTEDDVKPTASVSVEDGATNVDLEPKFTITFNENVAAVDGTLSNNEVYILSESDYLAGTGTPVVATLKQVDKKTVTVSVPSSDALTANTNYVLVVEGMEDVDNNAMDKKVVRFTTGLTGTDTTAPTVENLAPTLADGTLLLDTNSNGKFELAAGNLGAAYKVTFSEPIKSSTVNEETVVLYNVTDSKAVPTTLAVAADSESVTIAPDVDLEAGKVYRLKVTTGVQDAAGNAVKQDKVWLIETPSVPSTPTATIAVADDGSLVEGAENGEVIAVSLSNGAFTPFVNNGTVTLTGLPTGVTQGVTSVMTPNLVYITLSGNSSVDYDTDKVATVNVSPAALTGATTAVTGSYTFVATVEPAPSAPTTAAFDFITMALTGVNNTMEYSLDAGDNWNPTAAGSTNLTSELANINSTDDIQVRVASTLRVPASNAQTIDIVAQAAPAAGKTDESASGANDGTITGVTDEMEYQLDGAGTWTPVASGDTTVTDLAPGSYNVRLKATGTKEAGEAATVTIAPGA